MDDEDHANESLFFDRLKRDTRPQHDAIERAVETLSPFESSVHYRSYLLRTLGFYLPVEPALIEILGSKRAKLPALYEDLALLGVTRGELAAASTVQWSPPRGAGLWGCAYVLEGSTLGGRVLLKVAQAKLGVRAGAGARFLAGYGEHTGLMWTAFRKCLTRTLRADQVDELVEGAAVTFDTFTSWLLRRAA